MEDTKQAEPGKKVVKSSAIQKIVLSFNKNSRETTMKCEGIEHRSDAARMLRKGFSVLGKALNAEKLEKLGINIKRRV
jgi:hypothetical protein